MTKLNGVKNAIIRVTQFLNGPMFNLLFYCHITLYWEKVRKLWEIKPQSCPKSPNCLENFIVLMLYMEVSKCWKTVELKWKIVTHFSRPKQQAEIIQPPKFSNCIVKWMIFFVSFCWHWDFLLENLKIKKKHWWCPLEPVDEYKNVVCPK